MVAQRSSPDHWHQLKECWFPSAFPYTLATCPNNERHDDLMAEERGHCSTVYNKIISVHKLQLKQEQSLQTAYVRQGEYGLDPESVSGYGHRIRITSKI